MVLTVADVNVEVARLVGLDAEFVVYDCKDFGDLLSCVVIPGEDGGNDFYGLVSIDIVLTMAFAADTGVCVNMPLTVVSALYHTGKPGFLQVLSNEYSDIYIGS